MQFKLARLRLTKTERANIRKDHWTRAICILQMKRHQEIDLFWCRRFLMGIVADPLVAKPFGKVADEGPFAKRCLELLELIVEHHVPIRETYVKPVVSHRAKRRRARERRIRKYQG